MSQQLAYVIITPYSLYKSRTGGILTRLITRTGLDLVGIRMFAPSAELVTPPGMVVTCASAALLPSISAMIEIPMSRMKASMFCNSRAACRSRRDTMRG